MDQPGRLLRHGARHQVEIREFGDPRLRGALEGHTQLNAVQVWTRGLRPQPGEVARCRELLSREEHERADRYRVEWARANFILTRGALRSLVGSYIGKPPQEVSFRYSEFGKPSLDEASDLHFNVSHTDGMAVLAFVKNCEVGVDVERIRPELEGTQLAERFFSIVERHALENLSGDELHAAFFRCWTRKEAYVKARGDGLSLPLNHFDVSIEANAAQALLATRPDASDARRWTLCDLAVGREYAAALAVAEAETRPI